MVNHLFTGLIIAVFSISAIAMAPISSLEKKESFGSVVNYRDEKNDVDLSVMESDLEYADLTQENVKSLNSLFSVKKEYGSMFGFKDWTPGEQKLIQEKNERIFVLQGQYKDAKNTIVHFLEVYWADSKKAGQYLITSNSKRLSLDSYKEYLK